MTVRRGTEWGDLVAAPDGAAEVTSDGELAAAIGGGGPPVVVRGGDLHRALGAPPASEQARRVPIDVLHVVADGADEILAVAHVVVRLRGQLGWWRGPIVAAMNVDHLGAWDVAPRAHPNDGWLDVVEVSPAMSVRARWQARRRLATGTHVPHPDITVRRARSVSFEFVEPLGLWVDRVPRGTVRSLAVTIEPDAAVVYV